MSFAQFPTKIKVLSLYKKILKIGKKWENSLESEYIQNEARKLFKKNKNINNMNIIEDKIFEAETRIELALHYKIPYPRLTYAPPGITPLELEKDVHKNMIKPKYMDSYDY